MITCSLRNVIDPDKAAEFEAYGRLWMPLVERFGGRHHGYFLPHEGANNVAVALFSLPSLAAYEQYRSASAADPDCREAYALARRTRCIVSYERSFLRPVLGGPGANADATSLSDALAEELEKFQGTWKQVACETEGVPEAPDEAGREPRTTFTGSSFVVTLGDGAPVIKGTFTLGPAREPRAVDWTDTFGEDAGKTFPAIYSLEGDRLVFCAADPGQERPKEFRTGPGQVLRVHERLSP